MPYVTIYQSTNSSTHVYLSCNWNALNTTEKQLLKLWAAVSAILVYF